MTGILSIDVRAAMAQVKLDQLLYTVGVVIWKLTKLVQEIRLGF